MCALAVAGKESCCSTCAAWDAGCGPALSCMVSAAAADPVADACAGASQRSTLPALCKSDNNVAGAGTAAADRAAAAAAADCRQSAAPAESSRSALFSTRMCTACGDNGSSGASSSASSSCLFPAEPAATSETCSTSCACWAAATARRTPSASIGQSVRRSPALSVTMTCSMRKAV